MGASRAIADTGWGELRRQLEYKARWRGGQVVIANRWYPSSKTCSNPSCGVVKAKLRLDERIFRCEECGLSLDRDRNAARNLAALARAVTACPSSSSYGATLNEPEETRRSPALSSAAGTATGTPRCTG
ncbi:RNA-guided endonuclease InsQ/TnpB family protein [Nocardia amikacinitolerans]|uniref:RNA-guided endonuclease InsQ/TnpB family protein n=1 Tax=Nocardia amikacinitolerans TaxID=756689 RepID=UPI003557D949